VNFASNLVKLASNPGGF